MIQVSNRCQVLVDLLKQDIRSGPLINCDESTLQVLKEPGRKNTTKSYMWVYCGGEPEKPAVLYEYHPTRNGQVALDFLKGYEGFVQSDAFGGYNHLGEQSGIIHLGCWAHARRKFIKVVQAKKRNRQNPKGLAEEALEYIKKLYQIERLAKEQNLNADGIFKLRQEKSEPVLDAFQSWLIVKEPLTPPKGLLGKAIHYTLSNWDKLTVYINDGILKPDNNEVENAIRPFVVGRKNWLFAGAPSGASASATFFSIIETAKKNKLEPYAYLRHLFEKLPFAETEEDYRKLLPYNFEIVSPDDLR
jgi:transposase